MRRLHWWWCVLLPLLLFLLLTATSLTAQGPDLANGARVRVHTPTRAARAIIGTVDASDVDRLTLRPLKADTLLRIPWSQVARLEVSAGPNRRRGRAMGALVGFGASVAAGFLCLAICPTDPDDGANLAPVGGVIYGIVLGVPIGALLGGSRFAPERWQEVPGPVLTAR